MLPSLSLQAPGLSPLLWLGWAAIVLAVMTEQANGETQAQPQTDHLTPIDLRCEYRENPRGIDVTAPRLSWIVESSQRGQKQTAYHILVATDETTLSHDRGDL